MPKNRSSLLNAAKDGQIQAIRAALAGRRRSTIPDEGLRPSAVLVPLCWIDNHPHVVLTRRSMQVEYHKGEISFPGGGVENGDSDRVATALREAHEEIGLAPSDVDIIGLLDDYLTLVGYHITPVIGTIPYPYDFHINAESEALLFLPLNRALAEDSWMSEDFELNSRKSKLYFLQADGGVVWGATGRMLKQFADIVAGRELPAGPLTDSARDWVADVMKAQEMYRQR